MVQFSFWALKPVIFFNPFDLIKKERLQLKSNAWDNLFLKQIIFYIVNDSNQVDEFWLVYKHVYFL